MLKPQQILNGLNYEKRREVSVVFLLRIPLIDFSF